MKNHIILLLCLVNVSSYCQTNKAASRWIFAGPQAVEAVYRYITTHVTRKV
ncbi:MAG: hypothetical protein IPI22_02605 [Bacteroidetes bacterium]|nr:hypothetical protein [Bacteroidota bacterium]